VRIDFTGKFLLTGGTTFNQRQAREFKPVTLAKSFHFVQCMENWETGNEGYDGSGLTDDHQETGKFSKKLSRRGNFF
jgi:hypothetical protein